MPTVNKIVTEKNTRSNIIEKKVDHQNDPFVLKKIASANEVLNRSGMQEQLKNLVEKQK